MGSDQVIRSPMKPKCRNTFKMIFHLNRIGEIRVDVAGPVGRLNFQPKLFFKPKSTLSKYDNAYVPVV